MASRSRLVASTVRSAQLASSFSANGATTSSRCSQLSSTSSDGPRARYSCSAASSDRPGPSLTPSSAATAWLTNPARTGTRSTNTAPDGYLSAAASAVLAASRVLPTPPGPTRVTIRLPARAASTAACSRSRPMKLVRAAGSPATSPVARPASSPATCPSPSGPTGTAGSGSEVAPPESARPGGSARSPWSAPGRRLLPPSSAARASNSRSAGGNSRASAISRTVDNRGAFRRPCSIAATVAGLIRHRPARASWVRLAATRNRRSNSPKDSAIA